MVGSRRRFARPGATGASRAPWASKPRRLVPGPTRAASCSPVTTRASPAPSPRSRATSCSVRPRRPPCASVDARLFRKGPAPQEGRDSVALRQGIKLRPRRRRATWTGADGDYPAARHSGGGCLASSDWRRSPGVAAEARTPADQPDGDHNIGSSSTGAGGRSRRTRARSMGHVSPRRVPVRGARNPGGWRGSRTRMRSAGPRTPARPKPATPPQQPFPRRERGLG